VEGQVCNIAQDEPETFVLATGKTTSIREFIVNTFSKLGITLEFKGNGADEKGIVSNIDENKLKDIIQKVCVTPEHNEYMFKHTKSLTGKAIIKVDKRYFRPAEVDILLGDATKAKQKLGWEPKHTLDDLINDMIEGDLKQSYREFVLKHSGFDIVNSCGM
jgi:GDPmannose 4,6-dehydratase